MPATTGPGQDSLRVLFTGGGTAGHVTPNVALLEEAKTRGWVVSYIGSTDGIEQSMITALEVPFYGIASGKLRRYFSWQNFVDPLRIFWGICQSVMLCLKLRPDVVFSKGGFVSVPVVFAAWLLRVPVICHESDVTPGLANRLAYPFCRRICVTFEATVPYLPSGKVVVTGTPVRRSLLIGDAKAGRTFLGFDTAKPILLVFGGSLGASTINHQVRRVLPNLLESFQIVHVTGNGNVDPALHQAGYRQKAFIADEFGDVLAASAIVVSRAGANSIYELLLARKPHLLIPLSRAASRGDQLDNARVFAALGYSQVLYEEELSDDRFVAAVRSLYEDIDTVRQRLETFDIKDSVALIAGLIQQSA